MRIDFIGTGADDYLPGEVSRTGEYRRRTSVQIDGVLEIDLAGTTPEDRLSGVSEVIFTHSHRDHYDRALLCRLASSRPLSVYAPTDLARRLAEVLPAGTRTIGMAPGDTLVTAAGFRLTALAANHVVGEHPAEQPLHYIIEHDGRRVYWGTDGAWIAPGAWSALRAAKPFDRMILDGTLGDVGGDGRIFTHNSLPMVCALAAAFREAGLLKPNGEVMATHFSRDSHYPMAELDARLAAVGVRAAHDDEVDVF